MNSANRKRRLTLGVCLALLLAATAAEACAPFVECVMPNADGTYTAFFGYHTIATPRTFPLGPLNNFSPGPADRGQPTVLAANITYDWPNAAVSVVWDGQTDLVWSLNNLTATASSTTSPPCARHVYLDKQWVGGGGPTQLAANLPPGLASNYKITATSTLGTATCTYPAGASQLVCKYANQRPPATDNKGLWVPEGGTYSVSEVNLPPNSFPLTGVGDFVAPNPVCAAGYNGVEKYCLHTVQNQTNPPALANQRCLVAADNNPGYAGTSHSAFKLPGISTDLVFSPKGTFQENSDGTGQIVGNLVSLSHPTQGFQLSVLVSGFTTSAPPHSPRKQLRTPAYVENGGPIDPATWYYYTSLSGTLIGFGDLDGAVLSLTGTTTSFQVGTGASGKNLNLGASAPFKWQVVSQPTNGVVLPDTGSGDSNSDITFCFVVEMATRNRSQLHGVGSAFFWRTHPEAWPVDSLVIGDTTYSKAEALRLLFPVAAGDKTSDLVPELIAAKLNTLAGATSSCVAAEIKQADGFLFSFPLGSKLRTSSAAWTEGGGLKAKLEAYNNGRLCASRRQG
ncbi:MAG TPA: hypothetical protein VFE33_11280 [Thermoanaerobaculia bacterium]|nr:hypothetical protein [Thermoanaerobaculia bacterium]